MEGTYIPRYAPEKRFKLTAQQLSDLHYGEIVFLDKDQRDSRRDDQIFEWCRALRINASWAGYFYVGHKEKKYVWVVRGEANRLLFALRWL